MSDTKFKSGRFYYQYGVAEYPVISTWVYVGYEQTPGVSSSSCDLPGHFYVFKEWNGIIAEQEFNQNGVAQTLRIPSLSQANQSMLTWEELAAKIGELDET